ncbi:hypothetical protein FGO68_gene4098 [Halteria grandinella]|uniref:Uncharacterized protein n=1 Tax=Halteria grandinella TaxID=5974 RepID=A0A8J8NYC3_HALGN|nr:hypothetical protein FGO68_gene4098 [Halteria grandinella]
MKKNFDNRYFEPIHFILYHHTQILLNLNTFTLSLALNPQYCTAYEHCSYKPHLGIRDRQSQFARVVQGGGLKIH